MTNATSDNLVIGRMYGAGIIIQRTNNEGSINAIIISGPTTTYGRIQVLENGKIIYRNMVANKESEWNFGCSTLAELKAALANV